MHHEKCLTQPMGVYQNHQPQGWHQLQSKLNSLFALASSQQAVDIANLVRTKIVHRDADETTFSTLARLEQFKVLVDRDGVQDISHVNTTCSDYRGSTLAGRFGSTQENAELVGTIKMFSAVKAVKYELTGRS